jgi:uncharacterized oligopeptide transporter (OPT) family protein
MPFNIVTTYTLGCLLRIGVDRVISKRFSEEVGIPVAAGLIVGEALVGVGIAIKAIVVQLTPTSTKIVIQSIWENLL